MYGYDLDADGVIEATEQGTITWDYDALGRLTEETFSDPAFVDSLFTYDLAGNRKRQQKDTDGDGTYDEDTEYVYDANDRLREENVDTNGDGQHDEKVTHYDYGLNNLGTQQTLKRVWQNGVLTTRTTNGYDLQGRLKSVMVESYDAAGVTITRRETTSYVYDAAGIRVVSTQETDADGDGTGGSTVTTTTYLSDPHNPTGYAQTLEEVTKDGIGIETKRIVYTLGHDQISQTVYDDSNPTGATHTFHADGHGSTRVLTDAVAAILQHYAFDAYGNALGFDPAAALTNILYSGEQFDSRIGQTYLRARWYDATTGRFNRLDPFFGNTNDPQSLHKYLYVHGDPVNGVDPTGLAFVDDWSLQGIAAHIGFSTWAKTQRPHVEPGITLGTIFDGDLVNIVDALLKPDLTDPQSMEYFELKPVRHKGKPNLQAADALQMAAYDLALGPKGYSRGDSRALVPYSRGGLRAGSIIVGRTIYTLKLWPADDPMQLSGLSGEGFVWYEVEKTNLRRPPTIQVPVTETVRVYQGERVRIRTWDPLWAPVMETSFRIDTQTQIFAAGSFTITGLISIAAISTLNSTLAGGAL